MASIPASNPFAIAFSRCPFQPWRRSYVATPSSTALIGSLLQVHVERCIDAQAGFVHLLGAETLFKFAPHFLLKPGRNRSLRRSHVEPKRLAARLIGLGARNHAVGLHLGKHQVSAAQRLVGIQQGRVSVRRLGQAGQQSGFG